MKILLPPSETKHEGGDGSPLDLDSLVLPSLNERRSAVLEALIDLAADEEAARRVLKLSERQRGVIALNRALRSSPTLPAIHSDTCCSLNSGRLSSCTAAKIAGSSAASSPVICAA